MEETNESNVDIVVHKLGLDPKLWAPIFIQHKLITDEAININKHDDELYKQLCKHAVNTDDIKTLEQIFKPSTGKKRCLGSKLEQEGLDCSYWLTKLEKELGITSISALSHIGEDDFVRISKFITKPWEGRALRKLLNLPSEKERLEDGRKMQLKRIQDNQERLSKAFDSLKKFSKEGKERIDVAVREEEDAARKALDIPEDYWVPKTESLSKVVDEVDKTMKAIVNSDVHKPKCELSDMDLLQHASGGLVLKGIFVSDSVDTFVYSSENLIEVPSQFSIRGPSLFESLRCEEFQSKWAETNFEKNVSHLGHYAAISLNLGVGSFGVKTHTAYKHSSETESSVKTEKSETYTSIKKFCFVPLASCYFEQSKISLSSQVIKKLKAIEKEKDVELARKACEKLFETYGSHANKGPIHFGGVYTWTSSIKGFQSSQNTSVKNLTTEALDVHVSSSFGILNTFSVATDVSAIKYKGKFQGNYSDSLMCMAKLNVTKVGGPPQCDHLPQWKTGLIADKSTWHVIDRGENYIPIWEVIDLSHQGDFSNPQNICRLLVDVFTSFSKLNVDISLLGDNKEKLVCEIIKSVQGWNLEQIEDKLHRLSQWKAELTDNKDDPELWLTCVTDKGFIDFFLRMVSQIVERGMESSHYINILVQHLIGKELSMIEFEGKDSILHFLYDRSNTEEIENSSVSTFEEIEKVLEDCYKELVIDNSPQRKIKVKKILTLKVNCLRNCLRQNHCILEEMFLVQTLEQYGYQKDEQVFNSFIESINLKIMLQKLKAGHKQLLALMVESNEKAEAFALFAAITSYRELDVIKETSEEDITLYIMELQAKWGALFQTIVRQTLMSYPTEYSDSNEFVQHLENLQNGIPFTKQLELHELKHEIGHLLERSSFFEDQSSRTHNESRLASFNMLKDRLGLPSSKKLSLSEALMVNLSQRNDISPTVEKELVPFLLKKLMKLDYRAAHFYTKQEMGESRGQPAKEIDPWDDSFSDQYHEVTVTDINTSNIHPMDVLLTLIMCSDMMLQQYVFTKLAACQLAVPIVMAQPGTDKFTFMLWAARTIKKSWKSSYDCFVSTVPTVVVSFVKIGSPSISKSSIINCMLNNQDHNIFYHRHCGGSQKERNLLNGVIEVGWYLPSREKKSKFSDIVTVLNLRGDIQNHTAQFKYLAEISNVMVVLSSEKDISNAPKEIKTTVQNFKKSGSTVITLFTNRDGLSKECQIAAKGKSEATISELLHGSLLRSLENVWQSIKKLSLEEIANSAERFGFSIDEKDDTCVRAKEMACALTKQMENKTVIEFKSDALHLQGELWKKWCELEKQLCRIDTACNETIAQRQSKIRTQMRNVRAKQLELTNTMHPFMKSFIEMLSTDTKTQAFYLKWLKFYFNCKSQEELPELHQKYHKLWQEISASEKSSTGKTQGKSEKLSKMDKKISDSSLGMEHLMRELGQIYCAVSEINIDVPGCGRLPKIAAEMLISGQTIELMDGDVAHVPLTWISAMLSEVSEILNNPRIFIISVLGNQSTGKSTLLNTMFGLEFLVSGGRCTKGAFMQMLPVKKSSECLYDYILVIDTEGLRSSEKANLTSKKHDNELATFVIGIGDVTIINIFGENPADIEDILQITVEAFLRMSKVKLKPQCFFVHQNVGDVNISDRTVVSRRHLQERLDKMTAIAAEHNVKCEVVKFSDVIQFDIDHDVAHISGLWKGDPPMAPPNPGYSEKVEELQSELLKIPRRNALTISEFQHKIKDLWTALLHENFVFSFKSALEMFVYGKLEKEYAKWKWELHNFRLVEEQLARRRIENEPIVTYHLLSVMETEIEKKINCKTVKITEEMEQFFQEDDDKEILCQWEQGILEQFLYLRQNLYTQLTSVCKECIEKRIALQQLDSDKFEYEKKLVNKAKKLATELKRKEITIAEVETEFKIIWREIIDSVRFNDNSSIDIQRDAERVLYNDTFTRQKAMVLEKLDDKPFRDHGSFQLIANKHISHRVYTTDSEERKVTQLVGDIREQLTEFLHEKQQERNDYNASYFMSIIHDMNKSINHFESSTKITLKPEFKVDLALVLFACAINVFELIHANYEYRTSPKAYLNSKKSEYLKAFKKLYNGAKASTIAADFFVDSLRTSVESSVKLDIGRKIADEMKATEAAFNGNRAKLETCILIDLAERENFQDYRMYIVQASQYFEKFIQACITKYCFSKKKGIPYVHQLINRMLDNFKITICTAVVKATENTSDKAGNIEMWGKECSQLLKDTIDIRECILRIKDQDIGKDELPVFTEEVLKKVDQIFQELTIEMTNVTKDDVLLKWHPTAKAILKEQLGGCWDCCPFCSAVCTNTITGHDGHHSAPFHRPEGLTGTAWESNNKLSSDICSSAVMSNYRFVAFLSNGKWYQYKNYRDAGSPYSDWSITPDTSLQDYWKWVTCHFQSEWEEEYLTKFGDIPEEWKGVRKADIIKALKKSI